MSPSPRAYKSQSEWAWNWRLAFWGLRALWASHSPLVSLAESSLTLYTVSWSFTESFGSVPTSTFSYFLFLCTFLFLLHHGLFMRRSPRLARNSCLTLSGLLQPNILDWIDYNNLKPIDHRSGGSESQMMVPMGLVSGEGPCHWYPCLPLFSCGNMLLYEGLTLFWKVYYHELIYCKALLLLLVLFSLPKS